MEDLVEPDRIETGSIELFFRYTQVIALNYLRSCILGFRNYLDSRRLFIIGPRLEGSKFSTPA